jgi:hypothetical protein
MPRWNLLTCLPGKGTAGDAGQRPGELVVGTACSRISGENLLGLKVWSLWETRCGSGRSGPALPEAIYEIRPKGGS